MVTIAPKWPFTYQIVKNRKKWFKLLTEFQTTYW